MVLISPFPDETQPYRLCCCWHMRSSRAPGSGWRRNTRSRVCSSTCTRGGDGEEGSVVKASNKLSPTPAPASTCCFGHAKRACCHILATACPRTQLTVATRRSRSLLHTHLLSSTTHTSLAKWSSALFSSPGKHIPFLTKTTPPPRSGVVPPRCDNPRQRRTPSTNLLSIVHL